MPKTTPQRRPPVSAPSALAARASVARNSRVIRPSRTSIPRTVRQADQAGAVTSRGASSLRTLQAQIEGCTQCVLLKPWRKFDRSASGDSRVGYLLVGEAPGRVSWENHRRFTGPAGLLIRRALSSIGHARYRDLEDLFYMTDVVKCHPGPMWPVPSSSRPGANRSPRASEVRACAPFLFRELQVLRPRVIVTFGKPAAESVEQALALCAKIPLMGGWQPDRVQFPHPSPRNRRTILKFYGSMSTFERAITTTFRELIVRLGNHA